MSRFSRNRIGVQVVVFIVVGLLLMALLIACGSTSSEPTQVPSSETVSPTAAPGLDGATLLETRCSVCHSADRATQVSKTADEWEQTVDRMIGNGAQLTDAEKAVLVQYLAENYGP
jgi:cytochrome c5